MNDTLIMESIKGIVTMAKNRGISISPERAEHLWKRASAQAKKQGREKNYRYIMGILKKMIGIKESIMEKSGEINEIFGWSDKEKQEKKDRESFEQEVKKIKASTEEKQAEYYAVEEIGDKIRAEQDAERKKWFNQDFPKGHPTDKEEEQFWDRIGKKYAPKFASAIDPLVRKEQQILREANKELRQVADKYKKYGWSPGYYPEDLEKIRRHFHVWIMNESINEDYSEEVGKLEKDVTATIETLKNKFKDDVARIRKGKKERLNQIKRKYGKSVRESIYEDLDDELLEGIIGDLWTKVRNKIDRLLGKAPDQNWERRIYSIKDKMDQEKEKAKAQYQKMLQNIEDKADKELNRLNITRSSAEEMWNEKQKLEDEKKKEKEKAKEQYNKDVGGIANKFGGLIDKMVQEVDDAVIDVQGAAKYHSQYNVSKENKNESFDEFLFEDQLDEKENTKISYAALDKFEKLLAWARRNISEKQQSEIERSLSLVKKEANEKRDKIREKYKKAHKEGNVTPDLERELNKAEMEYSLKKLRVLERIVQREKQKIKEYKHWKESVDESQIASLASNYKNALAYDKEPKTHILRKAIRVSSNPEGVINNDFNDEVPEGTEIIIGDIIKANSGEDQADILTGKSFYGYNIVNIFILGTDLHHFKELDVDDGLTDLWNEYFLSANSSGIYTAYARPQDLFYSLGLNETSRADYPTDTTTGALIAPYPQHNEEYQLEKDKLDNWLQSKISEVQANFGDNPEEMEGKLQFIQQEYDVKLQELKRDHGVSESYIEEDEEKSNKKRDYEKIKKIDDKINRLWKWFYYQARSIQNMPGEAWERIQDKFDDFGTHQEEKQLRFLQSEYRRWSKKLNTKSPFEKELLESYVEDEKEFLDKYEMGLKELSSEEIKGKSDDTEENREGIGFFLSKKREQYQAQNQKKFDEIRQKYDLPPMELNPNREPAEIEESLSDLIDAIKRVINDKLRPMFSSILRKLSAPSGIFQVKREAEDFIKNTRREESVQEGIVMDVVTLPWKAFRGLLKWYFGTILNNLWNRFIESTYPGVKPDDDEFIRSKLGFVREDYLAYSYALITLSFIPLAYYLIPMSVLEFLYDSSVNIIEQVKNQVLHLTSVDIGRYIGEIFS